MYRVRSIKSIPNLYKTLLNLVCVRVVRVVVVVVGGDRIKAVRNRVDLKGTADDKTRLRSCRSCMDPGGRGKELVGKGSGAVRARLAWSSNLQKNSL